MTLAVPSAAGSELSLDGAHLQVPALGARPIPISTVQPSACTQACPAGVPVKSYVSLIAEERFEEALQVVRERCPLPGVCGRVCTHPCEEACQRGQFDEPIAIRALKRFVADRELEFERESLMPFEDRAARIAVVGSGPAGLTAAWDLRRKGYGVTIFEADTEPGGMLTHGIADYRLPPEVVRHEVDFILRTGVDLKTGVRLGHDIELEALLREGYRAVVLATGAQIGRRLGLERETNVAAVEDALAFLRRVNAGAREDMSGRVLVVGGGSTAIETARAALRLGATRSEILYRRTEDEMPASAEEVDFARTEGVEFSFLVAPTRLVVEAGELHGLECIRLELGAPDASGRPRPVPIEGSEFVIDGDRILAAIGQDVDLGFLPTRGREKLADGRQLHVDPERCATRISGVFAAGDLLTGPSTVIQAIATGHRAASSVRHYLERGGELPPRPTPWSAVYELPDLPPQRARRLEPPIHALDMESPFEEVEEAFSAGEAVAEARRCLRCGPCEECRICAPSCSRRHVAIRTVEDGTPRRHAVVRASSNWALALDDQKAATGVLLEGDGASSTSVELLPFRASVLPPECRGCESCVAICPFEAVQTVRKGSAQVARVDPTRCRGCNLCAAVCPTRAMRSAVFSPDHWDTSPSGWTRNGKTVLLCEHRAESLSASLPQLGDADEIIRLRCLGQLEPGFVLDVFRQGARQVVVGGCSEANCRFTHGSAAAGDVLEQVRELLPLLGRRAEDLSFLREEPS